MAHQCHDGFYHHLVLVSSVALITYHRMSLRIDILHVSRHRITRLSGSKLERCPFACPLMLGSLGNPPQTHETPQALLSQDEFPFVSVQIEN